MRKRQALSSIQREPESSNSPELTEIQRALAQLKFSFIPLASESSFSDDSQMESRRPFNAMEEILRNV